MGERAKRFAGRIVLLPLQVGFEGSVLILCAAPENLFRPFPQHAIVLSMGNKSDKEPNIFARSVFDNLLNKL
jgi:hypothetical protein